MRKNRKRRKYSGGNLFGAACFLLCCILLVLLVQGNGPQTELPNRNQQRTEQQDVEQQNVETQIMEQQATESEALSGAAVISPLEVHFIDVGQSDATLIKNGDYAMLIDAGDNSMGTTVQNYLQKQGIERLEYLVLTHTDADHIGGADVVITKFDIGSVFMGDYPKDNATYRDVLEALEYKELTWTTPQVAETYALGDASFTVIAPNGEYDSPNNTSIGLILEKGNVRFAFTGDAETDAETDILHNGMDLSADVYKVGHHGSSSSSSEALLDAMMPDYAVISCGRDNSYGYPHREVRAALQERGIVVFRTDEQGSIVAVCDGEQILWSTEKQTK